MSSYKKTKKETYFRARNGKDKKKWEKLKALDEMDGITYHQATEEYSGDNKPEWNKVQYIRILQTMKTYFDLTRFQYNCALYEYKKWNGKYILTPYGRASIDELLLAVCLHVQPKPDYDTFLDAIKDYECDRKKVLWIINNLFN